MTAFLTVDRILAHAATPAAVRRVLSAQWSRDADGRLVCCWLIEDPAPDRPPH